MLRYIFPVASLLLTGFTLMVDSSPRTPESQLCRNGGCRYDQLLAGLKTDVATDAAVEAMLVEDPANPSMWCAYGEFLRMRGEDTKAKAAFDRAAILGGGLSAVLMQVANFDFTHDQTEEGLRLAPRILPQTEAFDEILFSYLDSSSVPLSRLLGTALPANPRVARSWMSWLRRRSAPNQEVLETWAWMNKNQLADERSAIETTSALWRNKSYGSAKRVWLDWLKIQPGAADSQLLTNTHFERAPAAVPFDWNLEPSKSVAFSRNEGLDVEFLGEENLDFRGVGQFTVVSPGLYRFSAEVKAEGLTTDQGPFFRITDAENPGRLSVETPPILGDVTPTSITLDFTVPVGSRAIGIQLARKSSLKFESKIAGKLHIYSISLVPLTGKHL